MSAAAEHHADALDAIANAYLFDREDVVPRVLMGLISAALAIEARLGELVEQQQTATLLAGSAYGLVTPALAEVIMSRAEAAATDRLRAETAGSDS